MTKKPFAFLLSSAVLLAACGGGSTASSTSQSSSGTASTGSGAASVIAGAASTSSTTTTTAPSSNTSTVTGTSNIDINETNRDPGDFVRAVFERSSISSIPGFPPSSLDRITRSRTPEGRAQLAGVMMVQPSGGLVAGDARLDIDFDASTMSGRAENFAVYTTANPGYYIRYTRVRDVNGSLALTGTVQQHFLDLNGTVTAAGTLRDTGAAPLALGTIRGKLPGEIMRNRDNGNRLFAGFTNQSNDTVTITASDGTTSTQSLPMAISVSE